MEEIPFVLADGFCQSSVYVCVPLRCVVQKRNLLPLEWSVARLARFEKHCFASDLGRKVVEVVKDLVFGTRYRRHCWMD